MACTKPLIYFFLFLVLLLRSTTLGFLPLLWIYLFWLLFFFHFFYLYSSKWFPFWLHARSHLFIFPHIYFSTYSFFLFLVFLLLSTTLKFLPLLWICPLFIYFYNHGTEELGQSPSRLIIFLEINFSGLFVLFCQTLPFTPVSRNNI